MNRVYRTAASRYWRRVRSTGAMEQPEVMEHRLLLAAGRRAADEDRFARLKTL